MSEREPASTSRKQGWIVALTGKVTEYQKRPQIVLDAKEQLKVQEAEKPEKQ